jgi:hypothetical protein
MLLSLAPGSTKYLKTLRKTFFKPMKQYYDTEADEGRVNAWQ